MKNRDYKKLVTIATAVALIDLWVPYRLRHLQKIPKLPLRQRQHKRKPQKKKRSLLIQNHINLRQYMQRQTKTETSHLSLCLTS